MGLFNRSTATADAPVATEATTPLNGVYTIDAAHSRVGFSARHAMVTTVRGQFNEFEGSATFDSANPAGSSAQIVVKTASIDTHQGDRDAHLRSDDFFASETYPEIRFASTSAVLVDAETWELTGDLTIKDVTKPLTITFEYTGSATDPFGNQRAGFEGAVTVNRKDWGLGWNAALETGGVLVSEKVKLEFDISAIAAPAQA
ncbi:YceI family protein [Nocardioides iriomotensis]|uniref:Polyisoprenoid-binding protein n=1 Tax=Nocardioides iriomotensis TaxID=715784 RepID=A0A4Q5JB48_9ACTN|nr:YceI family protein [Nocardioides iriomotensis]RYU15278.1 polyisoprenoid-binding protein [Nocardioides iriomotensis]